MKNSTPLRFTQIIMLFFLTCLFFSCDVDKNKLKEGVKSVTEELTDELTGDETKAPSSINIGDVDIKYCDENVDNHHGCSCDFKGPGGKGASIFISNLDVSKSACVSINGNTEIVTGKRVDPRKDHIRHSHVPDWIVLDPDGDVHIFNELVDDKNYEVNKDLIIETMLVMHDLPEKMRIRKNKDADGKEVSAELSSKYEKMWKEAYSFASGERVKGDHGAPIEIELENDSYKVFVKGKITKHNDDGSDHYVGSIDIESKNGGVKGTKNFEGNCQCED